MMIFLTLLTEEMNMNKESHMGSPRSTANSLASFIPSNLHDSQETVASQLSPSAPHSNSGSMDKINTPLLMQGEKRAHGTAPHAPQILQQVWVVYSKPAIRGVKLHVYSVLLKINILLKCMNYIVAYHDYNIIFKML